MCQIAVNGQLIDSPLPEYVACHSPVLPSTNIARFTQRLDDTGDPIDDLFKNELEWVGFEVETPESRKLGFKFPCKGDSGGGHWVRTSSGKHLLVGIEASSHGSYKQPMYCGESASMQKTFFNEKPYNILDWIKWSSGLRSACYTQLEDEKLVVHLGSDPTDDLSINDILND